MLLSSKSRCGAGLFSFKNFRLMSVTKSCQKNSYNFFRCILLRLVKSERSNTVRKIRSVMMCWISISSIAACESFLVRGICNPDITRFLLSEPRFQDSMRCVSLSESRIFTDCADYWSFYLNLGFSRIMYIKVY